MGGSDLTLLAAATALLTACADAPTPATQPAATATRDSAGVRIVETDPAVWPPPEVWTVSDTPTVNIGVRQGSPDYELFQVTGGVARADGGTVIAEFGARLRYYDAEGVHVRTLEREGEGPGEALSFQAIQRYRGDSLLVRTGRMHSSTSLDEFLILAEDGTYGRDLMAWYPGRGEASDDVLWAGVTEGAGTNDALSDGSFVVRGGYVRIDLEGSAGDILPGRAALMRVNPLGEVMDTITTLQPMAFEYRPLAADPYDAILEGPTPAQVRAHGQSFYLNDGARYVVDVYEARPWDGAPADPPSARLVRSYRLLVPPVPTTDATREEYISTVIDIFRADGDDASRAEYRDRAESLMSPDSLPVVQDLRVDAVGNIWLEEYRPPGRRSREIARDRGLSAETGPSPWIVLDPEGSLLGTVLMPMGLEVFEIGDDHVLGMWTDPLGVEHVRRHAIVKR